MQKTNLFAYAPLRLSALLSITIVFLAACNGPIRPLLHDPAAAANSQPLMAPTPTATVAFAPDGVTLALETVVEDLDSPLFVTHAGDGSGRLFVVEKEGTIRIVADDAPGGNPISRYYRPCAQHR